MTASKCLVLIGLIALAAGCTNTIVPPQAPAEARTLYLLDLGRHTRLAFERSGGGLVEYGYGEWRWYALMENRWWRVPAVLLWPTQGTLGRREWRGTGAEERFLNHYAGLFVLELPAQERRVEALLAKLDAAFERRSDERILNEAYGLEFVPNERAYWLFSNSNNVVSEWLQEVGYTVRGTALLAEWQLAEAER
jgi:hypothetical protein